MFIYWYSFKATLQYSKLYKMSWEGIPPIRFHGWLCKSKLFFARDFAFAQTMFATTGRVGDAFGEVSSEWTSAGEPDTLSFTYIQQRCFFSIATRLRCDCWHEYLVQYYDKFYWEQRQQFRSPPRGHTMSGTTQKKMRNPVIYRQISQGHYCNFISKYIQHPKQSNTYWYIELPSEFNVSISASWPILVCCRNLTRKLKVWKSLEANAPLNIYSMWT